MKNAPRGPNRQTRGAGAGLNLSAPPGEPGIRELRGFGATNTYKYGWTGKADCVILL